MRPAYFSLYAPLSYNRSQLQAQTAYPDYQVVCPWHRASTDIEIAGRDVKKKQRAYDSEEDEDIRRTASFSVYTNADSRLKRLQEPKIATASIRGMGPEVG